MWYVLRVVCCIVIVLNVFLYDLVVVDGVKDGIDYDYIGFFVNILFVVVICRVSDWGFGINRVDEGEINWILDGVVIVVLFDVFVEGSVEVFVVFRDVEVFVVFLEIFVRLFFGEFS